MNTFVATLAVFGLVVTALSVAVVVLLGHRNRHRWAKTRRMDVGDGAYRGGTVTVADRSASTPSMVTAASTLALIWATLTALVFAPAGLLLAWILSEEASAATSVPVALVSLHGLALAVGLVVAAVALLRARPGAARVARRVSTWSIAHHLAVLGAMALIMLVELEMGAMTLALALVPCLLGLGHAVLVGSAADDARRLDVDPTPTTPVYAPV